MQKKDDYSERRRNKKHTHQSKDRDSYGYEGQTNKTKI